MEMFRPVRVQGYWLMNFPALHERMATQMNDMIKNILKWVTINKKINCQKNQAKRNAVDNYRLISCLPLMSKLMNGIISNSVYEYFQMYNLFSVEHKECRRKTRDKRSTFNR